MSKQNDGGPAFPRPFSTDTDDFGNIAGEHQQQDGMTLREWYRGMALVGIAQAGVGTLTQQAAAAHALGDLMIELRHKEATDIMPELVRQFRVLRNELNAFGNRPEIEAADALLAKIEGGAR